VEPHDFDAGPLRRLFDGGVLTGQEFMRISDEDSVFFGRQCDVQKRPTHFMAPQSDFLSRRVERPVHLQPGQSRMFPAQFADAPQIVPSGLIPVIALTLGDSTGKAVKKRAFLPGPKSLDRRQAQRLGPVEHRAVDAIQSPAIFKPLCAWIPPAQPVEVPLIVPGSLHSTTVLATGQSSRIGIEHPLFLW
jgi:hypothetical protein